MAEDRGWTGKSVPVDPVNRPPSSGHFSTWLPTPVKSSCAFLHPSVSSLSVLAVAPQCHARKGVQGAGAVGVTLGPGRGSLVSTHLLCARSHCPLPWWGPAQGRHSPPANTLRPLGPPGTW